MVPVLHSSWIPLSVKPISYITDGVISSSALVLPTASRRCYRRPSGPPSSIPEPVEEAGHRDRPIPTNDDVGGQFGTVIEFHRSHPVAGAVTPGFLPTDDFGDTGRRRGRPPRC